MNDTINCALCSTRNKATQFICGDNHAFAIVNIEALKEGHIMVLPTRHVVHLSDMNAVEAQAVNQLIDTLKDVIKKEYHEDCIVVLNTGRHGTQEHIHFHVLPSSGGLRCLLSALENIPKREKRNENYRLAMIKAIKQYL